jgi:hypothetical protein
MQLIIARLAGVGAIGAPELRAAMAAAAHGEDALEHCYAEAGRGQAQLVFFVSQPTPGAGCEAADRICRRALRTSPWLAGWRLLDCVPGSVRW